MKRQTRPFTVEIKRRPRKTTGQGRRWDASALLAPVQNDAGSHTASDGTDKAARREAEAFFTAPKAAALPIPPLMAKPEELNGPNEIEPFALSPQSADAEQRIAAGESVAADKAKRNEGGETNDTTPRRPRRRQRLDLPLRERWKRHLPIWKR